MSVESTLKEIKDLLAKQARTNTGGAKPAGAQGAANIEVSSEAIETANERVGELRERMQDLRNEIAQAQAAGVSYEQQQKDLTAATKEYNDEVARTRDELSKTSAAQKKLKDALFDIKDAVVGVSSKLNDVQSFARELERTGATSKEVSRAAIRLGDDLRLSGVSYEEVTQSAKALAATVTDFTMMDKEMQNSLMKDASLFAEVGVSNDRYTSNMQIGMKQMGLSAKESAAGMRSIRKTAMSLQIPVTQLMEDFGGAKEKLAELGDTGIDSFNSLARISKITGLEMGKLIAMTDKFDTFEGAAEQAGSLNAALGGNFVDSMSLMMTDDPAERFEMIRDAIDSAGTSVEDMTRKQKMFMANAAGFESVSDFTAAMSGDLDALKKEQEGAGTGDQIKSLEDSATLIRSQTELAANFAKSLEPAYGILGDKAMDVTDDLSDNMYAFAKAANNAQKAIAELTPAYAAAALGQVESVQMGWDKYAGIISAVATVLGNFGKTLWGVGKRVGGFFKNFRKGGGDVTDTLKKVQKAKVKYNAAGKVINAKTGQFVSPKNLSRMQKMSLWTQRMGAGATNLIKKLPSLGSIMTRLSGASGAVSGALRGLGGVFTRLGGIAASAIGSVVNMVYEGFKGLGKSLKTEGNNILDHWMAWIFGLGKGAAEAIDFLTFGLLDKLSSMTNSLGMGFMEAWEELDFSELGLPFVYAFELARDAIYDFLGISSPSKLMMEIGANMIAGLVEPIENAGALLAKLATTLIDYFIAPFTTIGTLLMEVIEPALDMVPDSIKSIFMGDTTATANNLQTAASPAQAAATLGPADAASGNTQPQVINISLNLDGKEIDKKVINVIGGVVKQAVM